VTRVNQYAELRDQLRRLAAQTRDVLVPSNDLVELLDYIDELEEWDGMGEDL
jgi:hypothetical protein